MHIYPNQSAESVHSPAAERQKKELAGDYEESEIGLGLNDLATDL